MSPPPTSSSRRSLDDRALSRYARSRGERDLEELVLRYRPLARSLARRYAGRGSGIEDLEQVACMGLIKALQRFDPERGCAFATFAIPTILGELRRFCRDTGWTAHVPRGMQERVAAVRHAHDALASTLGRTPSVPDVACNLGWPAEDVLDALVAGSTRATIPFEMESEDSAEFYSLTERLGDLDPGFELVECLSALESSLPALTFAQKKVLRLRFEEDLNVREIARRLDVPDSHVSRLLSSAIATLREMMGVASEPPADRGRSSRRQRRRRQPDRDIRARECAGVVS
ncbi:MAG: sigma-70 family RNA polymerase sigma factor [Actinomycetota bacterium]|nr:sigma-70 family RNA polymerase sigma factor [Actinomycetota bacterium]